MQKKRKDNQFIKKAFYEGGNTAFRKFVSENLKYPEEAVKNDVEGIVHLKIDIDHKGKVIGVKLVKGIGHGCDIEAMRIIRKAKYEVPANPKKMRIIHHKNIRIQFTKPPVDRVIEAKSIKDKVVQKGVDVEKVPEVKNISNALELSYKLTQKKKQGEKQKPVQEKPNKTSYSYTIKFNS